MQGRNSVLDVLHDWLNDVCLSTDGSACARHSAHRPVLQDATTNFSGFICAVNNAKFKVRNESPQVLDHKLSSYCVVETLPHPSERSARQCRTQSMPPWDSVAVPGRHRLRSQRALDSVAGSVALRCPRQNALVIHVPLLK